MPDEKKRQQIIAVAARLFASQPFHKVKLDEVAAKAGVGKGTLYIYFPSKEDLYLSMIHGGLGELLARLKEQLADPGLSAWQRVQRIVRELVEFAFRHPQLFELIRAARPPKDDARWRQQRQELTELVERTIRAGVEAGELRDANPTLTALFIPGMVRSAMVYGPKGLDQRVLVDQILGLLERGVGKVKREK